MSGVDKIIEYAMECIGTPFVHQGRVVGVGLDCAGHIIHICTRLNLPVIDIFAYSRQPFEDQLVNQVRIQPFVKEINKSELCRGDFFICRVGRKYPQHLGVFDGTHVIHATAVAGKTERIRFTHGFKRCVTHCFRFVINGD